MTTLTIAYYHAIKYIRNPLTLISFIVAPIIIIFILTGSTEFSELKPSQKAMAAQVQEQSEGNSNLHVTIIESKGALRINDRVSMASMAIFLFYGALLTSHSIINDIKKNTHIRYKASPIRFMENFLGKSIGNISILALSTLIILFITKYLFQVNWSGNVLIILIAFLLFLIIINSFGIIVSGFTKNIYISALATFSINFAMIFGSMSEAFTPIPEGSTIDTLMKFSIHNYFLKTLYGTVTNNTVLMEHSLTMLALIAAGMLAISYIVGRRVLR